MKIVYKKINKIDFEEVSSYEYAVDEYFNDISFYDIASNYLCLNHLEDFVYDAEIKTDSEINYLKINAKYNNCFLNFEPINIEELIYFLETGSKEFNPKIDINNIIKKITGIDLKDYVSHVWYKSGGDDYIDVKGKKKINGTARFIIKDEVIA